MQRGGYGGGRGGYGRGGGGEGGGGGRGRGWYYKQKYGGGGGHKRPHPDTDEFAHDRRSDGGNRMEEEFETEPQRYGGSGSGRAVVRGTQEQLKRTLVSLDGRGYAAYKDIIGSYDCGFFTLLVDHIQSDPFAPPSHFRAQVPHKVAQFPPETYSTATRAVALADFLTRVFYRHVHEHRHDVRTASGGWGGAKGGELQIDKPSQHVLPRTSVIVTPAHIEVRFTVALPAQGRSIMGEWAATIVTENVPRIVRGTMCHDKLDAAALRQHVLSVEDQEALRNQLKAASLLAFVRNGAILPRKSGACDEPMSGEEAVPFQSPPSLEREFTLPNSGKVKGMAIARGITLIVGGGFHGKSTLLEALQVGVYNKIPGDGREFVVCDPDAVTIRAEDGRSIENVNISPFIGNLPRGKSTTTFSTPDASGSTSQAANIMEALELGCSGLLIDEDKSATNFMIRDKRMQMLVAKENEPITPFIYKVRSMYADLGVSSVLVIGGSGDYFDVADTVIMMQSYVPHDVTAEAKDIAARVKSELDNEGGERFGSVTERYPLGRAIDRSFPSRDRQKIKVNSRTTVLFGETEVDLSAVEQIVERSQTNAIADALLFLKDSQAAGLAMDGRHSLRSILHSLEQRFDSPQGLDVLNEHRHRGTYARPRRFEVAAAVNRLRTVSMTHLPPPPAHPSNPRG